MTVKENKESFQEYLKKEIVLDTKTPFLYIGTLTEIHEGSLTLENAEVLDQSENTKSRDLYILEALKHGIKVNRNKVRIFTREVVSVSLLTEVKEY